MFHFMFCSAGFSCFTLCFVLLDSLFSLYVLFCWIHVFHFVFCAVGFTCFPLCFVLLDLRGSPNVLYCWVFVPHYMFCVVGFTCFTFRFVLLIHVLRFMFCIDGCSCFTLRFVLLDSFVSPRVLCCWIYVLFFVFCVVDSRVSICFVLLIHVFHFMFCAAGFTCFNCDFPAVMEKTGTNHRLTGQPLTRLSHRIQYSDTAAVVSGVAVV